MIYMWKRSRSSPQTTSARLSSHNRFCFLKIQYCNQFQNSILILKIEKIGGRRRRDLRKDSLRSRHGARSLPAVESGVHDGEHAGTEQQASSSPKHDRIIVPPTWERASTQPFKPKSDT